MFPRILEKEFLMLVESKISHHFYYFIARRSYNFIWIDLLFCLVCYSNKVAACAKHFVGDGGTTKGINENNTVTDWHGLLSIHMPGYYNSIIKGVSTIMVSYSSWNSEKMHANRDLVTNFLKDTLNFRVDRKPSLN